MFNTTEPPGTRDRLPGEAHQQLIFELEDEITRTAGHINAMDYYFIKQLAEFDEIEGWVGDGIKSFAHWLNWKCGLGALVAREKVRVARKLRELPLIDEAFRQGEVSYSKVRAMTRVATPANEECLLYIARHGTAQHVAQAVSRYRRCRVHDEQSEGDDWKYDKGFSWFQDESGMYVFNGRLPPEEGELVVKAIDKMVDNIKDNIRAEREAAAQEPAREPTTELAENPVESPVESPVKNPANGENNGENVSAETFYDRKPDLLANSATGLAAVAEYYLHNVASHPHAPATANADRYQILVHVNANDAHIDQKIQHGPVCYLDRGRFLAPEVARRLACDASVSTVLEDDHGNVLNVGRKSRTIPRAISIALDTRDQGCRFPSCHQRRHTDAHHIVHWADGGETSLDNLITLCRHHHTTLHNREYEIEKTDDQVVFRDRLGREIRRALYPQFPDCPDPQQAMAQAEARHRQLGLNITAHTAVTRWHGERWDLSEVIRELYEADAIH
jgi:hypothetical protein